jgi:hypothetical protein
MPEKCPICGAVVGEETTEVFGETGCTACMGIPLMYVAKWRLIRRFGAYEHDVNEIPLEDGSMLLSCIPPTILFPDYKYNQIEQNLEVSVEGEVPATHYLLIKNGRIVEDPELIQKIVLAEIAKVYAQIAKDVIMREVNSLN